MKIHIARGEEQFGPYSFEEVKTFLDGGNILVTDRAWWKGQPDWSPVVELPGLDAVPPPVPDVPAGPDPVDVASPDPVESSFDDIMDPVWFHRHEDITTNGMYDDELKDKMAAGELAPKGWVWTPGMASWAPASNFSILAEQFEQRASPPPLPPLRSDADPIREMKDAILFPFKNFAKVKKIWYLPLVQFIPVVGSIVNRGWRLEVVARSREDPFPGLHQLPRLVLNGALLWLMYSIYLMPEFVYLLLDRFSWFFDLVTLVQYAFGVITSGNPASGLGAFLADVGLGFILKSGFLIFYPIASWPFYRVAMVRYAKERKVRVFFQFKKNFGIVRRSYPLIMHVYVQNKLLWLCAAVAATLVTGTGVGFILVPAVIGPLRIMTSSLLYRNLAEKLAATEAR